MPVYGRIPPHTTMSLARTAQACGASGVPLELCMEVRGIVHWARDTVFDSFLRSDKQKLFWIDSDLVWEPDSFLRMVALSTKRDIICASYPAKTDQPTFQISGTGKTETSDELGLLPIGGAGLGFCIMDRSVCESIAATKDTSIDEVNGREMKNVFRTDTVNGKRRGEDIAFFADLRALGHTIYLDPSITLGHAGEKTWTGRALDALSQL